MTNLPSIRQLDELGTDAATYLQAFIDEIEHAIPAAASKADRAALAEDLKHANQLWNDYFGSER